MTNFCFDTGYIYGLYCLCYFDGIRYIGQTSTIPEKRLNDHISMTKYRVNQNIFLSYQQKWIAKHGLQNIAVATLEICFVSELGVRENWWIANTPNLTNTKPGGDQPRGYKMSQEVSAAKTGSNNAMYGKNRSELMDRIRKMRKPMSEENRELRRKLIEERRKDAVAESKRIEGIKRSHNSPEYLAFARERMIGKNNPNYGKEWSEERRQKTLEGRLAASGLTKDDIRNMRKLHAEGKTNKQIAAIYGYSESGMSSITSRKKWAWIED